MPVRGKMVATTDPRDRLAAAREALASPSVIDRVVAYFSPAAGLSRAKARFSLAMSAGAMGGYTGARRDRRSMQNWKVTGGSANADLNPDLPELRERSRDLVRNAPLVRGALNTVCTNVVGTGLALQAQIDRETLGLTPEQAAEWQHQAENIFRAWAGSRDCDISRGQTFEEMQDLVLRSSLESGDVAVMRRYLERPSSVLGLKLQLLEADRLSNPNHTADGPFNGGAEGHELHAGVEIDRDGAPVAYHFTDRHPGDLGRTATKWTRVEAFGAGTGDPLVLLVFKRLRVMQLRGEPYFAPVIEPLKHLSRYTEAEIFAAVVNSFFAVVTKTEGGQSLAPAADGSQPADAKRPQLDIDAGTIAELGLNESIESFTPGRPSAAFDPFVMAVLRQIGVALELPFEILIKHFTASYSAARAAIIEAWRFYRARRSLLARQFCQPVYEWLLAEAIARGMLQAPGFFDSPLLRAAWCGARWIGPGMGQINPEAETDAALARIDGNLSTLEEETAAISGGDWERNLEQRAYEQGRIKAHGLQKVENPRAVAGNNGGPPLGSDAEDETKQENRA